MSMFERHYPDLWEPPAPAPGLETDITLADTLDDDELARYFEDPDGFLEDYYAERRA